MPNNDAKYYMPFSALNGYNEKLREKENVKVEIFELTAEDIEELNLIITKIKKGDLLKVVYYKNNSYYELVGILTRIDYTLKNLTIVKQKIAFSSLKRIIILRENIVNEI